MPETRIVELIVAAALLVVALGLGIAVFIWVRNWRRQFDAELDSEASIETYRHLLDAGLLAPEEFERIQARLEGRPELPSTGIQAGRPPQPTDYRPGPPPADPTP